MTYQPGVPTGSVPLNQDYLNLQTNFTQINTQFEVDHVPLTSTSGSPPNGYHEAIHLVPVSTPTSNPPNNQPINGYTATTGYGQLFDATINDGINTDQALFFLTGGNRLMQLTRNFVPVAAASGYTFLPGGLILQWATPSGLVKGSNPLTFPLEFPNACYNIQLTPIRIATTDIETLYVITGSVTKIGFTLNNTSTSIPTAFYMAIGI
jgi:hypothetical protein